MGSLDKVIAIDETKDQALRKWQNSYASPASVPQVKAWKSAQLLVKMLTEVAWMPRLCLPKACLQCMPRIVPGRLR